MCPRCGKVGPRPPAQCSCDPTPPPSAVDEAERLLAGLGPGGEWTLAKGGMAVVDGSPFYNRVECEFAADARFIAAAPRLVRALVAEVRRLEGSRGDPASLDWPRGWLDPGEARNLRNRAEKAEADAQVWVDMANGGQVRADQMQRERDEAIARAEKAEAAYQSTLSALDRVHEREAALNEALGRANLEAARLRAAIEAHRAEQEDAAASSGRRTWMHDRALWAAL